MPSQDSNERYLIVGIGRCGSSILSAICANAGADFGMPTQKHWNRDSGAYEHPAMLEAFRASRSAAKLKESLLPEAFGRRYYKTKTKRKLAHALREATFLKTLGQYQLTPLVYKLGYTPKLIVVYRQVPDFLASKFRRSGDGVNSLLERYVNIYRTHLVQLSLYGGCAVSYEEITDPSETEWAHVVSSVTGLSEAALLESRDAIVQERRTPQDTSLFVTDEASHEVYEKLTTLRGRVIASQHR